MNRRILLLLVAVAVPVVGLEVAVSGGVALAFALGALLVYPARARHGTAVALLTAAALGPVVALAALVDSAPATLALVVAAAAGAAGYGARWGHDNALAIVPILAVVFSGQVDVGFALAEGAALFAGAVWGAVLLHRTHAFAAESEQGLAPPLALLYGAVLAVATGASTYVVAEAGLVHGYWVPMTILLVARPSIRGTWSMAPTRTTGTVAGVAVAVAIAAALPWSGVVVALAVMALAAGTLVLRDPLPKSAAITVGVVLLISGAAPVADTVDTATERLALTLAGVATVVAVCVLVPLLLERLGAARSAEHTADGPGPTTAGPTTAGPTSTASGFTSTAEPAPGTAEAPTAAPTEQD